MIVQRHIGGSPRLFQHITHLQLNEQPMPGWHLNYLNNLTHFAVPYTYAGYGLLNDLERKMLYLEVTVVILWTDVVELLLVDEVKVWLKGLRMENKSVYAVESVSTRVQEEWEDAGRGGLSIWNRAAIYTESLNL
jgi:hypothetical protein